MLNKIRILFQYFCEAIDDASQAIRHNYLSPLEPKEKRDFYRIFILAHSIEKGLSLKNPRVMFGREKIISLMNLVRDCETMQISLPVQMATGALQQYRRKHENESDPLLDEIDRFVDIQCKKHQTTPLGGLKQITEENWDHHDGLGPLRGRYSCRSYLPTKIDEPTISSIIREASNAPSQCNRQSVRVHCYQSRSLIDKLLDLQGGASGFSESISNLFVVSSDLVAWGGPGQRNQAYVDASLFAMSLMLACQATGIATCPLNLAVRNKRERQIKACGDIPPSERLVMMIAFGLPDSENRQAAKSPRLQSSDLLTIHGPPKSTNS